MFQFLEVFTNATIILQTILSYLFLLDCMVINVNCSFFSLSRGALLVFILFVPSPLDFLTASIYISILKLMTLVSVIEHVIGKHSHH